MAYVAPFALYIAFMAVQGPLGLPPEVLQSLRLAAVAALLLAVSRPAIALRPRMPLGSLVIGLAVFAVWVGPDLLFGPGYRQHWLFSNTLTGTARSSFDPALKTSALFISVRLLTSIALVPVIEELFWRGWLMRWLISKPFDKIPLGTYDRQAFWLVALLFAAEHGPYWDVGLAAGAIYNWWMVRTQSLADCIGAHAVTNAALAVYVLFAGEWQYWL